MIDRSLVMFFGWNWIVGLVLLISVSGISCKSVTHRNDQHNSTVGSTQAAFKPQMRWSERMAESIIKRNPEAWMTDFRKTPRWSYTHGLVLMAIQQLGMSYGDARYLAYAKSYLDTMITKNGAIKNYMITDYNLDNINPGKMLFDFYRQTGDRRYEQVIHTLRRQLKWQPRTTDGGYWHKLRYTYQMWLDGVYMSEPFYARYALEYNEPQAFNDIAHQFILIEKHTRNENTGLLHHGWDESRIQQWADPQTGKSPEVWGRAMGWYAMALVDVLDFFPEDHDKRPEIVAILNRLAEAIVKVQDAETGVWWQVLDKPQQAGNYQEASVSCMFTYALVKGVNQGYLEQRYLQAARQGFDGILENFVEIEEDGEMHIHRCCSVAGLGGDPYRDGSFEYYINEKIVSNDTKATGPFILASLEFEKLEAEKQNESVGFAGEQESLSPAFIHPSSR